MVPQIMSADPILYIKPGCPWCHAAVAFFHQHGVSVDIRDVLSHQADFKRMIQVSGQTLTPTLEYDDFVVPDFSTDELLERLEERPDVKTRLGLDREVGS